MASAGFQAVFESHAMNRAPEEGHLSAQKRTNSFESLDDEETACSSNGSYKCNACEQIFFQPVDFRRHLEGHKNERSFQCQTCSRCFKDRSNLAKHQLTHTSERPFACEFCGTLFKSSRDMKRHVRSHTGQKAFTCEYCGVAFTRSDALRSHRKKHTGETPYKCKTCSASFRFLNTLKDHTKCHMNETSSSEKSLMACQRNEKFLQQPVETHQPMKSFICNECGVRFATKTSLHQHASGHSGERPFAGTGYILSSAGAFKQPSIKRQEVLSHTEMGIPVDAREKMPLEGWEEGGLQTMSSVCIKEEPHYTGHMDADAENDLCAESAYEHISTAERSHAQMESDVKTVTANMLDSDQNRGPNAAQGSMNSDVKQRGYFDIDIGQDGDENVNTETRHERRQWCVDIESSVGEIPHTDTEAGIEVKTEMSEEHHHVSASPVDTMPVACNSSSDTEDTSDNDDVFQLKVRFKSVSTSTPSKQDYSTAEKMDSTIASESQDLRKTDQALTPAKKKTSDSDVSESMPETQSTSCVATSKSRLSESARKKYACRQCHSSFARSDSLRRHMRIHNDEKPFQCKTCARSFNDLGNYKKHQLTHSDEKLFACELCEASFKLSRDRKRHMKIHTGEKAFNCQVCGALFSRSDALNAHMKSHTDDKPYECGECGVSFKTSRSLNKHAQMHTSGVPYSCDHCQLTFLTLRDLQHHRRSYPHERQAHPREKRAICEECGARFSKRSNLKQHMLTHSGDRPFACEVCGKTYSQSYSLKTHMYTHTGERPYVCQFCTASFRRSTHLRQHMRTHSDERPFLCTLCPATFRQPSHLKVHSRTHIPGRHKNESYQHN